MAETTLSVNKESVLTFLRRGGETRFVIPEYQRPYAWTEDEIRTLFDDLKDFTKKRIEENEKETYFLGCIVSYKNQNNELEIIDGQQRITTLMLLLRAIYAKLENSDTNEKEVANFISKVLNKDVQQVIDPTILIEHSTWDELVDKSKCVMDSSFVSK